MNSELDKIVILESNPDADRDTALTQDYDFSVINLQTIDSGVNIGTPDYWATIDDFTFGGNYASANQIAVDPLGDVVVVGTARNGSGTPNWIVRMKKFGQSVFNTIDTFNYPATNDTEANAVAIDPNYNVYVGGFGHDSNSNQHWLIRKLQCQ